MNPKSPPLRDRLYLDWLRTQPCIITGHYATEYEAVDPAHIGTAGRGMKSPDDEALPIRHGLHAMMHAAGEASVLRAHAPNWLIREAFRALARESYRTWRGE